ncbi:DUF6318 family protein [Micrococcus sp. M4NT]|nr:DUF6318 family protein [Micrococcus sp. M4NT]
MPEVMKEETQEGAEAAVKYFWETMNYAEETGDPNFLTRISSKYCELCSASARNLSDIYGSGSWLEPEGSTVHSSISRPSDTGFVTTILINSTGGLAYNPDGSLDPEGEAPPADRDPWIAETTYDEDLGHWVVDEMTFHGDPTP